MSNLLALDTSGSYCSVALLMQENDGCCQCFSMHEEATRSHTRRLLPMVEEVLQQGGINQRQLDAIAYGHGPGSFTGLRIAAGVAQGFAFALDVPLFPVSTLGALALECHHKYPSERSVSCVYLVCLDARMGEVYTGCYQSSDTEDQPLVEVQKDSLCAPNRVLPPEQYYTLCGSGLAVAGLSPSLLKGAQCTWQDMEPRAEYIAQLAQAEFHRGVRLQPEQALPKYLRDEVAWQKLPRFQG